LAVADLGIGGMEEDLGIAGMEEDTMADITAEGEEYGYL
jgi:hypothetical protein